MTLTDRKPNEDVTKNPAIKYTDNYLNEPNPMAARCKAKVCGRALPGMVGSNPTEGMDVWFLYSVCVVRQRSLRRVDPSSRGVLPNVVCA
jgi:hypothetical protein